MLIIEDNGFMKALLKNLFCKEFDVYSKSNGIEALEWLHEGNLPHLIITDIRMPNMGGIEFLQNVKGSTFFHTIPLVVLSGVGNSDERVHCLKIGADDFIIKPFNPEELEIRVHRILKMNRA